MSRAIQYRQFGGPGVLEMAEVAEPAPGAGEVRVVVRAVGLNPVARRRLAGMRVSGLLGSFVVLSIRNAGSARKALGSPGELRVISRASSMPSAGMAGMSVVPVASGISLSVMPYWER